MLVYGVDLAVIIVTGILLLLQSIPVERWPITVLAILISIACVGGYITIYFDFISNTWRPLFYLGFSFLSIFIICIFFMTESLRFLYDKEKYEELQHSLFRIHRINTNEKRLKIGAKQYLKNRQRIKRKPQPNSLSTIKNEQNTFLNVVCLVVIWVCATFSYYVLFSQILLLKIDIYYTIGMMTVADILGYVLGYIFYRQFTMVIAFYRSFMGAIISTILLIIFLYAFQGKNVVIICLFLEFSKLFISSAIFNSFLAIFLVIKPRI